MAETKNICLHGLNSLLRGGYSCSSPSTKGPVLCLEGLVAFLYSVEWAKVNFGLSKLKKNFPKSKKWKDKHNQKS